MDCNDNKPLPAITICPVAGFKQKGLHYKVDDLLSNTLELSEIINNSTYNETLNNIYEVPLAQQFGRCFSYHNNTKMDVYGGITFSFKPEHDLKIFIHPKGDEIWFTGFWESPYEIAHVTLEITNRENFSLATLSLREVRSVLHPKPQMPCIDYQAGSDIEHELFAKCCKDSLWRHLQALIRCKVADMKQIIPINSSIPECTNLEDAYKMYWTFNDLLMSFMPNPWRYGCPLPCRQSFYEARIKYFHNNNAILREAHKNLSEGHFTFYPYMSIFLTEEKIESLEYDLTNLLVAAGGNLGLFLGFSCLSVLFGLIEWIRGRF